MYERATAGSWRVEGSSIQRTLRYSQVTLSQATAEMLVSSVRMRRFDLVISLHAPTWRATLSIHQNGRVVMGRCGFSMFLAPLFFWYRFLRQDNRFPSQHDVYEASSRQQALVALQPTPDDNASCNQSLSNQTGWGRHRNCSCPFSWVSCCCCV
jgi:hypothetical protein